jgi:hypothetical protein
MNIEDMIIPGMPPNDYRFILKYLKPEFTMFEWGSGGSTTYFSYFVEKYISIEHDEYWFHHTIKAIRKEERANVIIYWVVAPKEDYSKYSDKIHSKVFDGIHFDVVLIDGRDRVNCAKNLLDKIDDKCLVFLHDANRKRYDEIYEYYDIIDFTTTIKLLRKKKNGKN